MFVVLNTEGCSLLWYIYSLSWTGWYKHCLLQELFFMVVESIHSYLPI